MTDPILNDPSLKALSFALDGLSIRQRVTANNIANVDTPGFKAQQVGFEEQLQQALKNGSETELSLNTTSPAHLGHGDSSPSNLITVRHQNNALRNDDNNVDIDVEMTNLAETSLRYQALTQLAGMKLSLLRKIVREGK